MTESASVNASTRIRMHNLKHFLQLLAGLADCRCCLFSVLRNLPKGAVLVGYLENDWNL